MQRKRREIPLSAARDERGQTLVQVALMLVVLLGFAALAIDGGMVYAERRHMQNAADAGALAGARELCISGSESLAIEKARAFTVAQNGAASADVTIDPEHRNVVNVVAHIRADTFLAGVIGVTDVAVEADAAAACGAATSACGLWPIAFKLSAWEKFYGAKGGACTPQKIVVWNGDNENKAPPLCGKNWPSNEPCVCKDKDTGAVTDDLCRCYKCDENNDGIQDYSLVGTQGRAWLDLSGAVLPYTDACSKPGCGASELECHIRSDSGAQIRLPTCIPGDNGVKASVKDGVNSRAGDAVSIPLYDSIDNCTAENCPGGHRYHITKLGCINVGGWDHKFDADPYNTTLYDSINNEKVIFAYVNCTNACTTACGTTDGTPAEPWQVTAVNLIR